MTAATSIFYTPYKGNGITLYSGSVWEYLTSAQISIAVPATTNTGYDVFAYNLGGTVTLELTAWTNLTTRATALVYQNGVLCKSGALTRRYLGSFRTTGVSGKPKRFDCSRYLWNYYNRAAKQFFRAETAANWNYGSVTIKDEPMVQR